MRPFDLSKFRNTIHKSLKVKTGFHDPKTWISTGNYCLNYRISGSFYKGVPLDGKVTVFAGESGSGKSFIVSGNMIKWCMDNGVQVILMDSEDAVDRSWIKALGVDPDNTEGILRMPVGSPEDCAKTVSLFMDQYREQIEGLSEDEYPKVLFVLDSIGMLKTKIEQEQFHSGSLSGQYGGTAKQLKALVSQCIREFTGLPVGMAATNHVYASNDMYNPDDRISGGSGFIFASSVVVTLNKLKLKEDEDGQNKSAAVRGIRSKARVTKSRYSKPFEDVEIYIPYESGMSPYSGLFEMFCAQGKLEKAGNSWAFTDKHGEIHKYYRKEWVNRTDLLDKIMAEYEEGDIGDGVGMDLDGNIEAAEAE